MANELQEVLEDIRDDKLSYLIPQNIRSGVKILGVTGNAPIVNNQLKRITENGVYTPDTNLGYTGLGEIEVIVEDPEYITNLNLTKSILGSYDYPNEILVSFDTFFKVGIDSIKTYQNNTSGYVLTYDEGNYDSSLLFYFDLSQYSFNLNKIEKVELYAYYFKGDIPSRQQTHPVRKVMKTWTENTIIDNSYMRDVKEGVMESINTSNYGYGWRHCNITNLFLEWLNSPQTNFGVIVDNNRGQYNAGGLWNKMEYYLSEYGINYSPKLVLTYKE